MSKINKVTLGIATLALVVALGVAIYVGWIKIPLGGTTNYDSLSLSEDLTVSDAVTITGTTTMGTAGLPAYETRGGVDYADIQVTITATSSGIIRNPFGAASTTISGLMFANTSLYGGAYSFDIATSTSQYATSSPYALIKARTVNIGSLEVISWAPGDATTTSAQFNTFGIHSSGSSNFVLAPNEILIFKVATATPNVPFTSGPTGTFSGSFRKN